MEIIEIQSSHSLTTSIPENRPAGAHSYQINCGHFVLLLKSWEKKDAPRGVALSVITRRFERIWMTAAEVREVRNAIQTQHSPVALG